MKIILDEFNTKILNVNFGNVVNYSQNITEKQIRKKVDSSDFKIIGIKIDASDDVALYKFQKAGFYIVDTLVTYKWNKFFGIKINYNDDIKYRKKLNLEEQEKVAQIALKSFKLDRFHVDPNINNNLADLYYYHWVLNSFKGYADGVLVSEFKDSIAGFVTYKINNVNEDTSTIVLNAVDHKYRKNGIYSNMLQKVTELLGKYSNNIVIGTQVNNIAVQRTCQKLGYKLNEIKYVLHYFNKN